MSGFREEGTTKVAISEARPIQMMLEDHLQVDVLLGRIQLCLLTLSLELIYGGYVALCVGDERAVS